MPLPLPDFDRAVFEKSLAQETDVLELTGEQSAKLNDVFRAVEIEKRPAKWQMYGYLSLYKGQTFLARIRLFWDPKSIGNFAFEGNYYRGYDEELFRSLNWERTPESLSKQIETLKQSEMSHSFSATIPFSESYNPPRK